MTAGLKRHEAEHDWLTTVRLPPYASDLNPVEGIWSLVRRAMADTASDTPDDLDRILRASYAEPSSGPTSLTDASPPPACPSPNRTHPENLSRRAAGRALPERPRPCGSRALSAGR
ncbi:transposase [Streptomyces sp. NPDC094048]|uniref:transposase n=1 Tax=Streptomyces sp. NPDC094048 TaxID=3155207 RepID=UPI003333C9F0